MASLIQEYRKRHGVNFVLAVDEGFCYFDLGKKPGAIVLTSSRSRNITTCRQCLQKPSGIIAELFIHTGMSHPQSTYRLLRHEHLNPDDDLRNWVNETVGDQKHSYEPFLAASDRDIECWLWRFYIRNHPLFSRKWSNKEEPLRSLEQICWTINHCGQLPSQAKIFDTFYKDLYYTFTLGRKYLLYS